MNETLRSRIRRILSRNCLWMELLDEQGHNVETVNCGPLNISVTSPSFVLRVKRDHNGLRKNSMVRISERQIEDAAIVMCEDKRFKDRYESGTITVPDAEALILKATFGTLILDLIDY